MALTNGQKKKLLIGGDLQEETASANPPSLGNMLGVIALAFGAVALGVYALDLHAHTCEACGNSWRHLGAFNVGDPGSHTCSKCSTVQWWKDGVPHVFRSAIRESPPTDTRVSKLQEIRAWPREGPR